MNLMRYITGWATVRVSGAEPERVLRGLAERGIAFWDAAPPEDYSLTVQLPLRAARLVPPLAEALGCEGRVERRHGLPALFWKLRCRVVLLVGLAAALVLLGVSGLFVWDIQIAGAETVPEGVIRQALADCGVDIGTYWPGISQDLLRNSVILRVPELRWMTVSIRGSHALVTVREKRTAIEPVAEDEYVNIVSDKAGLVTEVLALRGTALTEVNRAVLPGDVLIAGYATGRSGVQGATRAIGSVTLRTWHEITAVLPTAEGEKEYTGEKRTVWALILGKTRINFYKGSSICPTDCDKIINRYTASFGEVFTLPLTLEKTVLREYAVRDRQAEELRQTLEERLTEELRLRIGEDGQVLTSEFSAAEEGGVLYVTLRAECQETAGVSVPLTEAELAEIEAKIPTTEENDP